MTTITRFHLSWLRTEALPELVSGTAGVPSIGALTNYAKVFEAAPTEGADWVKPWGTYKIRHHYWSELLGSAYARTDAYSAWLKQVPLRREAGFTPTTTVDGVTVTCERYLYPSGIGMAINATSDGEMMLADAAELHRRLCQDDVFVGSDGVHRGIASNLSFEVRTFEELVLGLPSAAPVGDSTRTVTTIAGSTGGISIDDATSVLKQLCYPGQQPGQTTVFAGRSGNFTETIRVAGRDSQVSWSPQRSTTSKGREGLTCYHHNVVLSTLHTEQMLNLVALAGDGFANAPDRHRQLYARAGSVLGWIYGGESAYSTRFSPEIIESSGLVARVNQIRSWLSTKPPLHLRQ